MLTKKKLISVFVVMSKVSKSCNSCRKLCLQCNKTFRNESSLATHISKFHREPKIDACTETDEEVKTIDPDVAVKEDTSDAESSTVEELVLNEPETPNEYVRRNRTKCSLGKLSYQLDPSFDLMDAYEVKNLFIKLKEDCMMYKRLFTGRYNLFIDAIIDLNSLTEVCSLLNSRAVMLKNIFKKLELYNPLWASRVRSFRLNANC